MERRQDIFSLLRKDHRTVKALFAQIEKTTKRASKTRDKLYARLREEIALHSRAEERALYPRLKQVEETKDIAYESVEEHALVKHLLRKLDTTSSDKEEWTAAASVLKEVIEHHVEEEESEMFSQMKRAFAKEELKALGEAFLTAKKGFIGRIADLVAAAA